jgi:hypothetical protein
LLFVVAAYATDDGIGSMAPVPVIATASMAPKTPLRLMLLSLLSPTVNSGLECILIIDAVEGEIIGVVESETAIDPRRNSGKDEARNPNEATGDARKDTTMRKANKAYAIVDTVLNLVREHKWRVSYRSMGCNSCTLPDRI